MSKNLTPSVYHVGDGMTVRVGSDRIACTVVKVSPSGKTITVQRDEAKVVSGSAHNGSAEYTYCEDLNGPTYMVRWSAKAGVFKASPFGTAVFSGRHEYYDPSF